MFAFSSLRGKKIFASDTSAGRPKRKKETAKAQTWSAKSICEINRLIGESFTQKCGCFLPVRCLRPTPRTEEIVGVGFQLPADILSTHRFAGKADFDSQGSHNGK
jgi:hypothetical protein